MHVYFAQDKRRVLMNKDELVFLPLGGVGEIGMNMAAYGFGPEENRQWLLVDCGVTFGGTRSTRY